MTIFELVKLALDELYDEAVEEYGKSVDDEIRKRMKVLSASYKQLNDEDRQPINYKDPATRFAYVYKYVAAHGDYTVQVLHLLREELEGNVFDGDKVRVSCVGGGPGSDIIAVLKYLLERKKSEPVKNVTCYLLDKEQSWADTWTELGDSLDVGIGLKTNFQCLDVTKEESWAFQKKFLKADLFTMIYFVSEVTSLDGDGSVSKFWARLFDNAEPGALFLYLDNGHDDFNTYFDKQCHAAKLKCILGKSNVKFNLRYFEEKAEVAEYTQKFGDIPKLQALVSYRVYEKP